MVSRLFMLAVFITSCLGCSFHGSRPQEVMERKYEIELVKIIGDDRNTIAGELTKPYGTGPFPAVVLISGSGPQNRDEKMAGHKPFLVLSDYLTRRGIAVLRYDDRGVGASSGNFSTATAEDFANDAAVVLSYLKKRSDIKEIGFIGHSEGGYIAPLASLRESSDFMVFLASPAKKLLPDTMLDQYQDILVAEGESASKIDIVSALTEDIYTILKSTNNIETVKVEMKKRLESIDIMSTKDRKNWLRTYANPWAMWYAHYNPEPALAFYENPVLALYGGSDLQVSAVKNASLMRRLLKNKNSIVKVFDDLNHLFQFSKTGAIDEYHKIETTIEPIVLETIVTWIKKTVDGKQ